MSLTNDDLKNIEELIDVTLDQKLDEVVETRLAAKEDLKHLSTKEEFYEREDRIMGELKAIREEMTVLSDLNRKVDDHEGRLEKIESKLQVNL